MPARKQRTDKKSEEAATPSPGQTGGRKPWKKKSPVEVFLAQEEKLRQQVEEIEAELTAKRRQLEKFEQARKIFEAT